MGDEDESVEPCRASRWRRGNPGRFVPVGDPPLVVISPLHLCVLITYFPLFPLVRVCQEVGRNGSFSQNFQLEPDLEGTDNNFEVYFINFICVYVFI